MPREIHKWECAHCRAGNEAETARQHRQMNLFLSRLNEPQRRWYVGMLSQQPGNPSDRELSKTWAGCPSRSFEVLRAYIDDTKTQTGLTAQAHLVTQTYATGVKVPDDEMETLAIQTHTVCPQWNYTISPRSPTQAT